MIDVTTKEIDAFVRFGKRKDVLQHGGISKKRYYSLKDDPEFMNRVHEERKAVVADAVRILERGLKDAAETLTEVTVKGEPGSQIRINAAQALINGYARLSSAEEILERIGNLEKALLEQKETV